MTPYQKFALWEYLTDFEDDIEFKDVLNQVKHQSDKVTVWEPYEDFDPVDLAAMIKQTATEAMMWFAPKDFRRALK
jgi:hypothetical protein